ncbi:hypothetical protein BKA70DRAFT_1126649 [Coprinopsis sp. MPI-PUGE-AT-0042]|nr:hypothetical protein BKA70DRAFT_1126649 [Coprinopsis sp. MPI-PUGE-AT-0042]
MDDIMVQAHPAAKQRPLYHPYENYKSSLPSPSPAYDNKRRRSPWSPFRYRLDFQLAEFMRQRNFNSTDMDDLLMIVGSIARTPAKYSLVDAQHVTETWKASAKDRNTRMEKKTLTLTYQKEECKFDVWSFDLWEWVLQLLRDPFYVSQMRWHALRLFRHNGQTFERFINEPWTANYWWQVQDKLPEGGVPFCIILYADKTKLSTLGTAKGYPVYARDANLPIEIRNSDGLAGGRMVALLPIVPEDADKTGKTSFVNFKHLVWHESFRTMMKKLEMYAENGCKVECGDGITRLIFPIIIILSADYEEQCVMANTRGGLSSYPCPVCLVPKSEQSVVSVSHPPRTTEDHKAMYDAAVSKTAEAREVAFQGKGLRFVVNVFWYMAHTDIYKALCWDRLHAYHGGLFSHHILKEFLDLLDSVDVSKREMRKTVERQLALFPTWRDLNHFKELAKIMEFSDGRKYEDLSKVIIFASHNALEASVIGSRRGFHLLRLTRAYLNLDMYASLRNHTETTIRNGRKALLKWEEMLKAYMPHSELKETWNFPKAHSHAHLFDDIEAKGVTRNSNTKPNEQLHGYLKEYYRNTNFKNVNAQMAAFHSYDLAAAIISENIERFDAFQASTRPEDDEDEDTEVGLRHLTVGSPLPESIPLNKVFKHVPEALRGALVPSNLRKKVQKCLKSSTNESHHQLTISDETPVKVYRYAKVNYESLEDSTVATDFLRMNPNFHGNERYDSCLLSAPDGQVFAKMVAILGVSVGDTEVLLAVLIPYDETLGESAGAVTRAKRERDEALEFVRVRARSPSAAVVVFAEQLIRGALLVEDFSSTTSGKDHLVVDVVDADMWLRMQCDRHLLATNIKW